MKTERGKGDGGGKGRKGGKERVSADVEVRIEPQITAAVLSFQVITGEAR